MGAPTPPEGDGGLFGTGGRRGPGRAARSGSVYYPLAVVLLPAVAHRPVPPLTPPPEPDTTVPGDSAVRAGSDESAAPRARARHDTPPGRHPWAQSHAPHAPHRRVGHAPGFRPRPEFARLEKRPRPCLRPPVRRDHAPNPPPLNPHRLACHGHAPRAEATPPGHRKAKATKPRPVRPRPSPSGEVMALALPKPQKQFKNGIARDFFWVLFECLSIRARGEGRADISQAPTRGQQSVAEMAGFPPSLQLFLHKTCAARRSVANTSIVLVLCHKQHQYSTCSPKVPGLCRDTHTERTTWT